MHLIATSPIWHLSGVNTFLENLFSEWISHGHHADIVLTDAGRKPTPFPLPQNIPVTEFPPTRYGQIARRQNLLIKFLLDRAPCTWLPNYDFNMADVIEVLPPEVKVIACLHSDEEFYYRNVSGIGKSCDAIVAVSRHIENTFKTLNPDLASRLHRIPYGVPVPLEPKASSVAPIQPENEPLKVLFLGRIAQEQKRIFDLVEIIRMTHASRMNFRFTIAGRGPDEASVRQELDAQIRDGYVSMPGMVRGEDQQRLLQTHHVLVLTSEYEGLPLSLLEAMAYGCIPAVTAINSGINEVVRDRETGFQIPIGDLNTFVKTLGELERNRNLLPTLSRNCRQAIKDSPFDIKTCTVEYQKLVEALLRGSPNEAVARRGGKPRTPWRYTLRHRVAWHVRYKLTGKT